MASTLLWIFLIGLVGLAIIIFFKQIRTLLGKASCALTPSAERCKQFDVQEASMGKIVLRVGAIVASILGLILGWFVGAKLAGIFGGFVIWLGIYVYNGLIIVPQKEKWAIERLGIFFEFKPAGWHLTCFLGVIDTIKKKIPLSLQETPLFQDEQGQLVEFSDRVSAFVRAVTWWRVKDDEASLMKFTYDVSDPRRWLEQLYDAQINPALEAYDYEVARIKRADISKALVPQLTTEAEKTLGAEITDVRLEGFDLIKESQEARDKVYQEEKAAEEAKHHGKKILAPALAIQAASGNKITLKEAMGFYLSDKSLDVVDGANLTLVADSMKGAVKTLDINQPKSKGGK